MALHQQAHPGHAFPRWLELVAVAVVGAAIILGVLLVAGNTDLLPGAETAPATPAVAPYTTAD